MKDRGRNTVTLLTDFGLSDPYVGAMKGALCSVNPSARIVDLSHGVEPGDIAEASFFLSAAHRYFPLGTIHVAVVDPGVGSGRRILCARTRTGVFLAPDNGTLTAVLEEESEYTLRSVTNEKWFRKCVSATFHARDIFAPVAGRLSLGAPFASVGPKVRNWARLSQRRPSRRGQKTVGSVISIDRFGNLITNLRPSDVGANSRPIRLRVGEKTVRTRVRCYSDAAAGRGPVFLVNSFGLVEIAVPGGSCANFLGVHKGAEVIVVG